MSDPRRAGPHDRQDEARLLEAAARERLLVAAADLALPERLRLTEWQRATLSLLNAKLIRTIEDELRSYLVEDEGVRGHEALRSALGSAHVAIAVPMLERARVGSERALVSTLVRRTEEHRRSLSHAAGEMPFLIESMRDADPLVAEQGVAILIGQSRRFDTFNEPAATRTELPAELEHRLVWRIAAVLRHYMIWTHGFDAVAADAAIVASAERLLAGYDEGDALDARAMRLARRLQETGRLDDALVERVLAEGSLNLFVAFVAARASLSHASAWEILSEPKGRGAVFLLRAAGVDRDHAASILLMLASSEEDVPAQVDLFDVTDAGAAAAAIRLWRLDSAYRDAIAELAA